MSDEQATARVLLVGISGPSSSGKTTVARQLRDLLNAAASPKSLRAFILHEDDFYKTDADIPLGAGGLKDWDCFDAIDLPLFQRVLKHVKLHGVPPGDFTSKEDKNAVGSVTGVSEATREECRVKLTSGALNAWARGCNFVVAIVDGFLLYSHEMSSIREMLDLRLFLRTDYATAKRRREARNGYVTLEGFWQDPPGYVEQVVWPNYVRDHAFMFEGGDVDKGEYDQKVCRRLDIWGKRQVAEGDADASLKWAAERVANLLITSK